MKKACVVVSMFFIMSCGQRHDDIKYVIEVNGKDIIVNNVAVKWVNDTDVNNWIRSHRPSKVDVIANHQASATALFFIGMMFVEANNIAIDKYVRCPTCSHVSSLDKNNNTFKCTRCGLQESIESFLDD